MNKLTKLLSVFVIAGAIGTGVAGITACNNDGGGGSGSDPTHEYTYTQNSDQKTHNGVCKVDGCTEHSPITNEACVDEKNNETQAAGKDGKCDKCGQTIKTESGGGEVEYDLVKSSVDFGAAANELAGSETTANQTVGTEGYTYGGKFFFASGHRFEPGNSCVNTQKKDITVTLGGVTNSIKIVGKGASGTAGDLVLKNASGTVLGTSTSTGNSAPVSISVDDLPQGVYTISSGTSIRITELSITEKLEKSEATGISVTASKIDFLLKEDFSSNGLTVILNYANGRKDTLSAGDYTVEQSVDKNTAGKYTVTVKYKENTSFTDTYDVYVYSIDSIEMHTIGFENKKQVTLQQAAVTNGTLSYDYLTVKGTGTVEGREHTFNLPASALNIENVSIATAGEKTVNVSVNTEYTTGGKALGDSYKVMVKDAVTATDNKVEVTVGATGDFTTLTQAVQFLEKCNLENKVNKVIKLQAGTYTEKVRIEMPNVTLMGLGDNIDDTKLTYSLVEGDPDAINGSLWGLDCATLHVTGANFKAYNLAIRNDFDYIKNAGNYSGNQSSQGLALTLESDGAVVYKCHLYGNQDTLFMKSGRSYYYQTQIDGNVDFIFGNESALAYFDECKIVAINRTAVEEGQKGKEQNGYVTAAKHDAATKPDYGYIFSNCEFTDDGKVKDGAMSLGRPWGAKATVAYINCSFSAAYSKMPSSDSGKDHRWHDWNSSTTAANADFCEYGSTGAGAITEAVLGGKILTEEQAANYTKANIFGTSNGLQTYTTVFDCDAAYSALRILVGLDQGEISEDPTVTINLKDATLPNGSCVAAINEKYGATFTWEGAGSFETAKPENGVKVGLDTVITFNVVGEVSIAVGYQGMLTTDYVITYSEGKATIKFTKISGQYGDYIGNIVVDTSKTPEDSVMYSVSFDLNGATEGTAPATQSVVANGKLMAVTDPTWTGHTFDGWYTQAEGGEKVDFETYNVSADGVTLYAHWIEGTVTLEPTLISAATDFNFGKMSGVTAITTAVENQEKLVDGLLVNGTFKSNGGGWYSIASGTTIKIKVAAGFKVVVTTYDTTAFNYTVNDGESTAATFAAIGESGNQGFEIAASSEETLITITATGGYIGAIRVIAAE